MTVDVRWKGLGALADYLNLEDIDFREYQYNIIDSALRHGNTLVVLPTGLGKTLMGMAFIADALSKGKRAMLLAPTKPLSEQHYATLLMGLNIDKEKILLLTGATSSKKRKELEASARVMVGTPQTVANDLKKANFSLEDFGAIVFDECHRAVGKYAYTYVANEAVLRHVNIFGLTASPGGDYAKIKKLVDTLSIRFIEARISTDPDVMPYVMPKYMHVVNVELSDTITRIAGILKPPIEESLQTMNKLGLISTKKFETLPKGKLIQIGNEISKLQAKNFKFAALAAYARLLNLTHMYDLLMTEGIYPFHHYLESLEHREVKSKTVEKLIVNPNVVAAKRMAKEAIERGEEHPKVIAMLDVLKDYKDKSSIVFVQYRSTIKMLIEYLRNNGFAAMPFVGKKEGVTQAQQQQVLADFRDTKFNVLVASSIGEEGLDIPNVDVVLFYEPIANEIRNIQRRGRTGRFRAGDIYILVARGTKDQVYLFVSQRRERKMFDVIKSINKKLVLEQPVNEGDGLQTRIA